jgi:hypothetical protein
VWTERVRRIDWKDRSIVAKLPKTTLPRCRLPRHALLSHGCMRGRLGACLGAPILGRSTWVLEHWHGVADDASAASVMRC